MKILSANIPDGTEGVQPGRTGRNKGWYNHGHLPHFDQGRIFQVITYRLSDSLPQKYLNTLQAKLESYDNENFEQERRKDIEELLDRGHGSCILKNKECAKIIEDNWQHFNGVRYKLISYVIMPNHVHVMLNPYQGFELGKIVKSWKSYSAKVINELVDNARSAGRQADINNKDEIAGQTTGALGKMSGDIHGKLWQRGYWDRYIRDEKHFYQTIEYIKKNFNNAGILLG